MKLSKRPLAAAAVLLLAGCGQLPGTIEAPASSPGLEVQSRSTDYQKKDSQQQANSTVVAVTVQTGSYDAAITQAGNGNIGIYQGPGYGQIAQTGAVNGANNANGLYAAAVLQSNTQALLNGGSWGGGQFAQVSQPIQQIGVLAAQQAAPQAGIQQVDGGKARFSQRSRSRQL